MQTKKFKYDIIAEQIIHEISAGKYRPGDKLPPESELISLYDVSRVTLRESLKKLSMMGIVEILQGDGTYIREITPSDFMKPLLPLLATKRSSINEIYTVRIYLESGMTEIAATNRTEQDLSILKSLLEKMETCVESKHLKDYSDLDYKFHEHIAIAAHNDIFYNIYKLFEQFTREYVPKINTTYEIISDSLTMHHQIYYAMVHARKNLARVLMHEHLRLSLENLLKNSDSVLSF